MRDRACTTSAGAPRSFIHHNGPVSAGINANVFGMREKGCEKDGSCFISPAMCNDPKVRCSTSVYAKIFPNSLYMRCPRWPPVR